MSYTSFVASGEKDRRAMLDAVGAKSVEDLFADIPPAFRQSVFDLPEGLTEMEMLAALRAMAARNAPRTINFCGAGFYDHFIPAAVDTLAARGEFLTAYTPYQPEASQGTLQSIFEFQTAIVRLTEMEVANASLYDGGTALFEALMMALRCTGRSRILVDEGVNPIYRTMLQSYTRNRPIQYEEIPLADGLADRTAFRSRLDRTVAAVLLQQPNFFGCVDDLEDLCAAAHEAGALALCSCYPVALGLVKPPGTMGVDIVTGEGQSLGIPLSFGGPYLGFMAARRFLARKMPGRIVGVTHDERGRRGFVLTLQAREQHIRREKATSNICTNEALCALRAAIYLALAGKQGLVEVAEACASRAAYAYERLARMPRIRPLFQHSFFNEFAVALPCDASTALHKLFEQDMAGGFPVGRYYQGMDNVLLLAFTEKHTREEIDRLCTILESLP